MYQVTIYDGINDTIGTVINSPYPNGIKLSAGNVNLVIQGISDMSFTINPSNPGWGKIKPLKTLIKVFDVIRKKTVFNGRVLKPSQVMTNSGMFTISYDCESTLAYLQDSNQRFGEYHNITVSDFFTTIIENHNRQVEPHKQFKVGNVTVTDPNNSLYRYLGYEKTFETIKDKLIDRLGGFLVVREEQDGNYIDYLQSVGEVSSTEIKLRKNLKDMKRDIDPLGIISRLVVLGKKIESTDPNATDASQARLDIKSVNNGLDYLDDPELIAEFGIIEGTIMFDDISDVNTLKTRGEQFLADQLAAKVTYTLTPVDVSLIDSSFEELEVGNWHQIVNPVFSIDEPLQIIEQDINILDPLKISLTIGEKYKTLTQYQLEATKQIKTVEQLEQTVASQSQTISNLSIQLSGVNTNLTELNTALQLNDETGVSQALADLNQSVSDLNTAVNNIPEYTTATTATDGLMSAADKTKLDGLQNYDLANDLSNGLMSNTDKAKLDLITILNAIDLDGLKLKLDLITVLNAVDLDNLVSRIEALENPTP